MKKIKFIIIIGLFTVSCFAQSAKLKVTSADYIKWGTLAEKVISPDGQWVSFKMQYESGNDTLFVVNTKTSKQIAYPTAISAAFSFDSNKIAIILPDSQLQLIKLKENSTERFSGVKKFEFLSDGNYLLTKSNQTNGQDLLLLTNKLVPLSRIENFTEYAIGSTGNIAVISKNGISIIHAAKKLGTISVLSDSSSNYKRLRWSRSGILVSVVANDKDKPEDPKFIIYNCVNAKTKILGSGDLKFDGKHYSILPYDLIISEDDTQLYFMAVQIKETLSEDKLVEVWDSTTLREYPEDEILKDPEVSPSLASWNIEANTVRRIDDDGYINSKVLPGGKFALSLSESSISSRVSQIPPADHYSINLTTGKRDLIVSQGYQSAGLYKVSPSGQYISYFKDGHYYVYDTYKATSLNITIGSSIDFTDREFDQAGSNLGYYSPGWSADSRFILLYDQYDVYLASPDGKTIKRITNGYKTKTRFRIDAESIDRNAINVAEIITERIDISNGIILNSRGDDMSTGYYWFSEKEGIRTLTHKNSKLRGLVKAKNLNIYVYIEETSVQPPRLVLMNKSAKSEKILFQSNKHYLNYQWSTSQLINYQNSNGDSLKAILMYPANYVPEKTYPMVVYIYERLSSLLHDYINPTEGSHIGFSPPTYLLDGYIVLMPDIKYEMGTPGPSALDCVTAAVKSVQNRNIINEKRIGLIGHSFGGFQTAYIISQSTLFAAAVAGGAVTDPVSSYLTMNFDRYRSNNWRFEDQQFRMNSSPFNNWDGYVQNSTIAHASNIETPLLLWSGKNDRSVNFNQGVELHLALRRLDKANLFLLYPNEDHILGNPAAKVDLTNRVKGWFDHYLKADD